MENKSICKPVKAAELDYIAIYPAPITDEIFATAQTCNGESIRSGYTASSEGYVIGVRGERLKLQNGASNRGKYDRHFYYQIASLKNGRMVGHPRRAARVILEAFVINPDPTRYTRIYYRDGNPHNLRLDNLAYWLSPEEVKKQVQIEKNALPFEIDETPPRWAKDKYGLKYGGVIEAGVEKWKPIKFYHAEKKQIIQDWYYISSWGRCYNAKTGKFLKPQLMCKGEKRYYYRLTLKDGTRRNFMIHWLVVRQFIVSETIAPFVKIDSIQVNHMDGNPANNRLENLELSPNDANIHHYWEVLKPKRDEMKREEQENIYV